MKSTEILSSGKEYNNIIDIMKLFFAIGVLGIHTGIAQTFPNNIDFMVTKLWFRMAVPFFFVATGFFYDKKMHNSDSKQKRGEILLDFCQKNGVLLIVFGNIALFQIIYGNGISREIVKIVHDAIFYPRGAMWYVAATIAGAIIIFILYDHKIAMVLLAIPLFIFALLCNNYYFIISNTRAENIVLTYLEYFVSARNGIFVGFPYMLCGVILFEFIEKTKSKNLKVFWIIYSIIVFAIYVTEVLFCKNKPSLDDTSLYITMPFLAVAIFYLSFSIKVPITKRASLAMRSYSKIIYFFHPVFSSGIVGGIIIRKVNSVIFPFAYTLAMCVITIIIIKNIKPIRETVGKFLF